MDKEQKSKFDEILKKYNINSRNAENELIEFIEGIDHAAYCRGVEAAEYNDTGY